VNRSLIFSGLRNRKKQIQKISFNRLNFSRAVITQNMVDFLQTCRAVPTGLKVGYSEVLLGMGIVKRQAAGGKQQFLRRCRNRHGIQNGARGNETYFEEIAPVHSGSAVLVYWFP